VESGGLPQTRTLPYLRITGGAGSSDNAYSACWRCGHQTRYGNDDDTFYDRQETYNDAELIFYDAIRRDLGLHQRN
jgi:hypothetical protein